MRGRACLVVVALLAAAVGGLITARDAGQSVAARPAHLVGPVAEGAVAVPPGAQAAVVRRHVDGDTLVLAGAGTGPLPAGRPAKVRLLAVDTPEVFGGRDCYGEQASAFTARLLPLGARVRVAADLDPVDRYGRSLLYLWTDTGVFVQQVLVARGYARAVRYPPNDRYIGVLRAAAGIARAGRAGAWSCRPLPARWRGS